MREVGLCVSEPLAAAVGLLCLEAPCLVASLLEKLHLLQGRRTHDLKKIEESILNHMIRFLLSTSPQPRQKHILGLAYIPAIMDINTAQEVIAKFKAAGIPIQ